jgi:hypothetical protein
LASIGSVQFSIDSINNLEATMQFRKSLMAAAVAVMLQAPLVGMAQTAPQMPAMGDWSKGMGDWMTAMTNPQMMNSMMGMMDPKVMDALDDRHDRPEDDGVDDADDGSQGHGRPGSPA